MTEQSETINRIDELPVSISIEIDRKQISIDALTQLCKGKVIQFSDEPPETVRVFANNTYFADATLITIENQVAVRIERIV